MATHGRRTPSEARGQTWFFISRRIPQRFGLGPHLLERDAEPDLMTLEHAIRLVATEPEGLADLEVRNPMLPVKVHEIGPLRLGVQAGPVGGQLVLDVLGNLEANVDDGFFDTPR